MAKNKKQKKHLLTGKIVIIIIILIFLLLVFGYYQKNRPNYRDLDKTYKKLVIPSDWKLVSKTEKKGTWGLFCWDGPFDTSPCPTISARFNIASLSNIKDVTKKIISSDPDISDNSCDDALRTCYITYLKNGVSISYQVHVIDNTPRDIVIFLERK